MSTIATEKATSTTTSKPRQSRASRSAAQVKAPAARQPAGKAGTVKAAPKPKAAAEPKAPSQTALKQAVAGQVIKVIADALSKSVPPGVDQADALAWAGEWCQYFPGVRAGKTPWDDRLGAISGAGMAKKS
jgi:hypothetical protein